MNAEDYLRRVDAALRDLPWGQRRELLAELRAHLAELPPGTGLGELGAPEQYAADLRAAAGLERRRGLIAFVRARRPRNVILAVVLLVLAGLAIGAVAWIRSYDPIATGNTMANPAGVKSDALSNAESVVFHKGRPFSFGISIRNTGSFPVRVLGVPSPVFAPFAVRLMVSSPPYHGGTLVPMVRFRPFDLQPGEERLLLLRGVYACNNGAGPGTELTFSEFPVRFRFLWHTATAEVPLDEPLTIILPKGCPSRPVPPPTP